MEFDKHHKVIPESLTSEEAVRFDEWLLSEVWRHWECVHDAHRDMVQFPKIAEIYQSAVIRHKGDIKGISELRIKLRELFEL